MKEDRIQALIGASPKDHLPMPYSVALFDKKGRCIATRYIRASSERRAKLTAFKVNRCIFQNKKAVNAIVQREGWTVEMLQDLKPLCLR